MLKLTMNPSLLSNLPTLPSHPLLHAPYPHYLHQNLLTFNPTIRFQSSNSSFKHPISPSLYPFLQSAHPNSIHHSNPRKTPSKISCSCNSNFSNHNNNNNNNNKDPSNQSKKRWRINSSPGAADVEMVKNRDGVWTAKQKKVVLLWDLDNKPPRGPPYHAAVALRDVAQRFGRVVDMSAYANHHAFTHLPSWVLSDRRERRVTDILERQGALIPPEPYVCGVCGRKCATRLALKKHFRQLHEREREKKLNRMRSLKGKKRQKYKERFISGNRKYEEAERKLITPKVGYGLASELRRAGVFVRTVEDKPQSADWALKRQIEHSIARGVDWLLLVSDDSDFSGMLCRARESKMRTVVIGDDGQRGLGRYADIWVPWIEVENGEVGDEILQSAARIDEFNGCLEEEEDGDGFFSLSCFDDEECDEGDESEADSIIEEIVAGGSGKSGLNRIKISAFSEENLYWVDDKDDMEID